jgi:DNA-binding LacI/PurR family transcriptional regulator
VADRLVAAIEQRPVAEATEVEVELVVRESTGPVPRV